VLADEDIEEDPDRWCSYSECGQERWQIACQWVWNLRLVLGQQMQAAPLRDTLVGTRQRSTSPSRSGGKRTARVRSMAVGQTVGSGNGTLWGRGLFRGRENGMLRCPAGASLWLSEVRQENALTQRAVYLASQTDCPHCELRAQCLGRGAKGNRARRVSAVRRLLPTPATVSRKPVLLRAIRWVDVAGRALRRTWMSRLS
jgi:hypothetical protein